MSFLVGLATAIGAPEIVIIGGVVVLTVLIVDAATPGADQRHAEIKNWLNQTSASITTALFAEKAGGIKTTAQHLAMLMGSNVAGYPPHSGKPDPDRRDAKHNAEGLRNGLKSIHENMRPGETFDNFAIRQGLKAEEIADFKDMISSYVKYTLPSDIENYGISQALADDISTLINLIGIP